MTDKRDTAEGSAEARREQSEEILFIGAKRALIGGILAGGVAIGGQFLVGQIYSGTEARSFLTALVPSARAVGTGVVSASATIMALMLTMVGLGRRATRDLGDRFFKRIERIGLLSTIGLSAGVLQLLILTIPLQESQKLPASWFTIVYYALMTLTAAISGLMVAIVLMLFNAMQSLIKVFNPDTVSVASESKGRRAEQGRSQK